MAKLLSRFRKKDPVAEAIKSVQPLRLNPEDSLLITVQRRLTKAQYQHFVEQFRAAFPNNRLVVLEDAEVRIIKEDWPR